MRFLMSRHAEDEMARRQIPREWLDSVLESPEQRIAEFPGKEILQSRFTSGDGKIYLLRAVVATDNSRQWL
jgi:hypothetical protein